MSANDRSYLDPARSVDCSPRRTHTWLGRVTRLLALVDPDRRAGLRTHRAASRRPPPRRGAHVRVPGKGRKRRSPPSPAKPSRSCPRGSKNGTDSQEPLFPTRRGQALSRYTVGASSPATAAAAAGQPPAAEAARRHRAHPARAPTRYCCAEKASTSRRSPCGSGTRAPRPPTSTSTPTPHSKNKQSHEPPRSAPSPAATDHPTRSSPSSKPCDYVEHTVGLNRQITEHQAALQHNRSRDIHPVTLNST